MWATTPVALGEVRIEQGIAYGLPCFRIDGAGVAGVVAWRS